jgi:hypothetical protein
MIENCYTAPDIALAALKTFLGLGILFFVALGFDGLIAPAIADYFIGRASPADLSRKISLAAFDHAARIDASLALCDIARLRSQITAIENKLASIPDKKKRAKS